MIFIFHTQVYLLLYFIHFSFSFVFLILILISQISLIQTIDNIPIFNFSFINIYSSLIFFSSFLICDKILVFSRHSYWSLFHFRFLIQFCTFSFHCTSTQISKIKRFQCFFNSKHRIHFFFFTFFF